MCGEAVGALFSTSAAPSAPIGLWSYSRGPVKMAKAVENLIAPGKTGVVIGFLHERFIHVPIELLATHTKRLDPASGWWRSVLATTGQPERFA